MNSIDLTQQLADIFLVISGLILSDILESATCLFLPNIPVPMPIMCYHRCINEIPTDSWTTEPQEKQICLFLLQT